jgi:hypothetical protein
MNDRIMLKLNPTSVLPMKILIPFLTLFQKMIVWLIERKKRGGSVRICFLCLYCYVVLLLLLVPLLFALITSVLIVIIAGTDFLVTVCFFCGLWAISFVKLAKSLGSNMILVHQGLKSLNRAIPTSG